MKNIYTIIKEGEENASTNALPVVERLTGIKARTLHDNFKTRDKTEYIKKGFKVIKSRFVKNNRK